MVGSSSCAQRVNSRIADNRSACERAEAAAEAVANRNACLTVMV